MLARCAKWDCAQSFTPQTYQPASVVTLLPQNFSFNRLSKPTRKSSFLASPIGFPCQLGMLSVRSPVFQGFGANRVPKCGKSNGKCGFECAFSESEYSRETELADPDSTLDMNNPRNASMAHRLFADGDGELAGTASTFLSFKLTMKTRTSYANPVMSLRRRARDVFMFFCFHSLFTRYFATALAG